MKLEKLSAVAELVSAVAILVTLGYLAIQTQQNTAALQSASRQAMSADERELLVFRLEYGVQELMNRESGSLSDAEMVRLSTWLVAFIRNRESQWLQLQSGGIDEETWLAYSGPVGPILSYELTRPWWEERVSRGEFHPRFVSYVNGVLSEIPVHRESLSEITGID